MLENALFMLPGLIAGMVLHELGHAVMAKYQGDNTAERYGRITMNPLKHMDPLGSIILPAIGLISGGFLFGWAKPVPINPQNFKNYKKGMILTSLAGPAMNIFLMIISFWMIFLSKKLQINNNYLYQILQSTIQINLILGAFNLIPIPPLDGSKILSVLLPYHLVKYYSVVEQYANIIFILILVSGLFHTIIYPFKLFINLIVFPFNYIFINILNLL